MDEERRARFGRAVASAIAEARLRAGLTQAEVAEALSIGPEAMSRIERGLVDPPVTRIYELADVLGCSVGDLVVPPSDLEADQARMLARIVGGLPNDDRDHVLKLATLAAEHLRCSSARR
jgi:transcriptional regulator with XRE-family HTH domain